jgi:hypothetical protein
LFETATLWHALLHPFEVGGSATGVLITDESYVPNGDDEMCAAILRSARIKKLSYVLFFGTIRPASIVCVTASAARFSAGSSRLTSLGPLQKLNRVIFNLLLSPYYGIIVAIGRERSRANEATIAFNSVKAILGHFDASSQLVPHCHAL